MKLENIYTLPKKLEFHFGNYKENVCLQIKLQSFRPEVFKLTFATLHWAAKRSRVGREVVQG